MENGIPSVTGLQLEKEDSVELEKVFFRNSVYNPNTHSPKINFPLSPFEETISILSQRLFALSHNV